MLGSWSHFNSAPTNPADQRNFGNSASHNHLVHPFSMPLQRKTTHELNLSQPSSKFSCWDHQACLLRMRNRTQLQECVPHFPAVWCVFRQGSWLRRRLHTRHGKDNVWIHGTDAPLSWALKALVAPLPWSAHVCFDSHHGHLVEFLAVVRDLAVLDSKLVPNTLCE